MREYHFRFRIYNWKFLESVGKKRIHLHIYPDPIKVNGDRSLCEFEPSHRDSHAGVSVGLKLGLSID